MIWKKDWQIYSEIGVVRARYLIIDTMSNKIIISQQPNQRLEIIVNALEGWDGFEQLLDYLANILSVNIIDSTYGEHDTRKCRLSYKNVEFELSYDTLFGNCIIADAPESKKVVIEIAHKLEDWL